jgi:hypothetical protein
MVAAVGAASYANNLAAVYAACGAYAILYVLHAVEVKLNRLLDHHGLAVPDYDIAKD